MFYSPSFFLVKRNCDSLASFLKTDCPFLTPKALILPCAGKGVRRIFAIRFATCLIRLNFEARAVILCFFQYAFFCQNCQSSERKIQNFVRTCKTFRAYLKNGFRKLRVPVCGRFCPNEGGLSPLRQPNEGKLYRKVGLAACRNAFSDTLQDQIRFYATGNFNELSCHAKNQPQKPFRKTVADALPSTFSESHR